MAKLKFLPFQREDQNLYFFKKLDMMVHGFTVLEMQKQADSRDLLVDQSNLLDEIQANIHTYVQRWGRQKWGSVKREGNVKKGQQSEGRWSHAPRQQRGHSRSTGA